MSTKDQVIKLRVSTFQKAEIQRKAKECGLSVSAFLISRADIAPEPVRAGPSERRTALDRESEVRPLGPEPLSEEEFEKLVKQRVASRGVTTPVARLEIRAMHMNRKD